MSGQNEAKTPDSPGGAGSTQQAAEAGGGPLRQRSTIAFPYSDLNDAIQFAQSIHDHVGHGSCDDDQLAAWVNQSRKSSGFRTQLSAARMFGVIESDVAGRHKLTPLGQQIVDPGQAREAKVHAFLKVPLYRATYEKYKGTIVPPTPALESDFVGLGVAEKQKDRARLVFKKSAEQAGFFENGKDRLVKPGVVPRSGSPNIHTEVREEETTGSGDGDKSILGLDPLLLALLQKIPSKIEGWNAARRVRWFRTFAMNVSQVYDEDDKPIELTIEVSGGEG